MKNFLIISFIFFFIGIPGADSKSSNEFIEFLGSKIYNECSGQGIKLKETEPLAITIGATTTKVLKWEYDKNSAISLIRLLDNENWVTYSGVRGNRVVSGLITIHGERKNFDGYKIITCGDNSLSINGYDYIWNEEKIEMPKETNIAMYNQGNLIQGSGNENNFQIISKRENEPGLFRQIVVGLIVAIILSFLVFIINKIKKYIKRKK